MSWTDLLAGLRAASLSAAVIILAALLLRKVFRSRTPQRVFCLLWDVALVRLLILRSLPSPLSIWRWMPKSVPAQLPQISGAGTWVQTAVASDAVVEYVPTLPGTVASAPTPLLSRNTVLAMVWLMVGLALAVWFLWNHLHSRWICGDSLPCTDGYVQSWLAAHSLHRTVRIRTSDRIASPLTYGVLRPVILLPSGMDWQDRGALSFILEHEYQHICHFDTLRKGFLAAALCLHWFSPAVWLLYVLANRDMELACDEAVTARGMDRAEYARTLLGMEERRSRWSLSGSHFSQNALEERIRSIMKRKKTSITALIAVMLIMNITVVAFATGTPDSTEKTTRNAPENGYVTNINRATEQDLMILSNGKTGEMQYSVDGGRTWMSEERYRVEYGDYELKVEWWTADEYAEWLENEKLNLQSIIGSKGYTSGKGWFTWDQAMVDETIALYESILENIKNGALYSKTVTDKNGNAVEEITLGSGTLNFEDSVFSFAEQFSATEEEKQSAAVASTSIDNVAAMTSQDELKPYGVDASGILLTYNGQLVRFLIDGVAVEDDGYAIRYAYSNPDGVVDIHTLRAPAYNADGSYDPMGKLIGVAARGDRGFDERLIEAAAQHRNIQMATADGEVESVGTSFEDIFAPFSSHGLVYTAGANGRGHLHWNGQPVMFFADLKPDGGVFSYQDTDVEAGQRVFTQYDADGNLTGLYAK